MVAARTVLAAAGGYCPEDRHPSCGCRWAGTAVPATVARVTSGPGRWCACNRPLSVAGSCRPSPDRQSEATSADSGRRGVMPGDRFGSLLLQRFAPMLDAPAAGVGCVDADDGDAPASRHGGQPIAESGGGSAYFFENLICAVQEVFDMFSTVFLVAR